MSRNVSREALDGKNVNNVTQSSTNPTGNTNANVNGNRPPSESSRGTSLTVVGNKFRVGRKIGEGSFGIIYEGFFCFCFFFFFQKNTNLPYF